MLVIQCNNRSLFLMFVAQQALCFDLVSWLRILSLHENRLFYKIWQNVIETSYRSNIIIKGQPKLEVVGSYYY